MVKGAISTGGRQIQRFALLGGVAIRKLNRSVTVLKPLGAMERSRGCPWEGLCKGKTRIWRNKLLATGLGA